MLVIVSLGYLISALRKHKDLKTPVRSLVAGVVLFAITIALTNADIKKDQVRRNIEDQLFARINMDELSTTVDIQHIYDCSLPIGNVICVEDYRYTDREQPIHVEGNNEQLQQNLDNLGNGTMIIIKKHYAVTSMNYVPRNSVSAKATTYSQYGITLYFYCYQHGVCVNEIRLEAEPLPEKTRGLASRYVEDEDIKKAIDDYLSEIQ